MEIIARFPALPASQPVASPCVEVEIAPAGDLRPDEPQPVSSARKATTARRSDERGIGFPIRSVLVLAVVAIVAWSLALKNDAARRQAARMAGAATESATR